MSRLPRTARLSSTHRIRGALVAAMLFAMAHPALAVLPPHNPVPGGVAVVALQASAPSAARFGDRRVMLARAGGRWHAVVGLSSRAAPGEYIVRITEHGKESSQPFQVIARSAANARRSIEIDDELAALVSASEFAFDARALNAELWRTQTNRGAPTPRFRFGPVAAALRTIPYGLLINDRLPDRFADHPGITHLIAADQPARAPAAGVVHRIEHSADVGSVIYLHHGNGLASVLSCIERSAVSVGERVEAGAAVGIAAPLPRIESGADTPRGRKTLVKSPYARVHWTLLLNGNRIDPLQFPVAP